MDYMHLRLEAILKAYPQMIQIASATFGMFDVFYMYQFSGMMITEGIIHILKQVSSKTIPASVNDRPPGIGYTSFFLLREAGYKLEANQRSINGLPSGHAANMGFLMAWSYLNHSSYPALIIMGLVTAAVSYSRVYYRCHTPFQVCIGYMIGATIAYGFHKILINFFD